MTKNLLITLLIILIAAAAAYVVFLSGMSKRWSESPLEGAASTTPAAIASFADCAAAGYPVMESYPRQCRTPDGRLFAEEIVVNPEYVNADADMIKVELPTPGAVTGKEFSVIGEARGNWYFEASFPIEVVDRDGNVLVSTHATADGDWMTTEFVPFKATVTIPNAYMGPATLILRKDNPSGDPIRDASMSLPLTIEY